MHRYIGWIFLSCILRLHTEIYNVKGLGFMFIFAGFSDTNSKKSLFCVYFCDIYEIRGSTTIEHDKVCGNVRIKFISDDNDSQRLWPKFLLKCTSFLLILYSYAFHQSYTRPPFSLQDRGSGLVRSFAVRFVWSEPLRKVLNCFPWEHKMKPLEVIWSWMHRYCLHSSTNIIYRKSIIEILYVLLELFKIMPR